MDTGKRRYSVGEAYRFLHDAMRTLPAFLKARKRGLLDMPQIERIMLAVTQVNGCPLCSYGHTKMALEVGMSTEEIRELLAGTMDQVPDEELEAVLFAQHYAEKRGRMDETVWRKVIERYGRDKARGILGAIRMIMVGNTYGIPLGSFAKRWKGQADPRSSLGYELAMILLFIPFLLVSAIHAVFV